MRLLTSFFKVFRSSLLDIHSYGNHGKTFWKGVRYLYVLGVILSIILGVKFAVSVTRFLPHIDSVLIDTRNALDEVYPAKLRVTIQTGALTTNVKTPFVIDVPPSYQKYFTLEGVEMPYLITIDPQANVQNFPSYKSLILLAHKNFVVIDKDSNQTDDETLSYANYRVNTYSSFLQEPLVITHEKFVVVASEFKSYFVYVKPLVVAFIILSIVLIPFLSAGILLLGSLIFLLWATLLLWIVSLIAKKNYSYTHLYVLSLFGITASQLYAFFERLGGFHVPMVSYLIFFVFMGFVIFRKHRA